MNNKNTSLINCAMCNKLISPNALFCPNCGEPVNLKPNNYKEKNCYADLILLDIGSNYKLVMQLIQGISKWNSIEIKSKILNLPVTIAKNLTIDYAKLLKLNFEKIGATVQIEISSSVTQKDLSKLSKFHKYEKVLDEQNTDTLTEFYDRDGILLASRKIYDKKATFNLYNENGLMSISEKEYEYIRQNGVEVIYSSNGNLQAYIEYNNGQRHGKSIGYNSDGSGKLLYSIEYKNNNIHGIYLNYNLNDGKLSSKIEYVDGKKHGKCFYYDSNNKISSEIDYKNDKIHGIYINYRDDKISCTTEYMDGKRHGKSVYYIDGRKSSETNYVNDKRHGTCIQYDTQGNPTYKIEYQNDIEISRESLINYSPYTPSDNNYYNYDFDTNSQIKCPTCNSSNISKISIASKAGSAVLFGLFSLGKISKTFECNNCGYKW